MRPVPLFHQFLNTGSGSGDQEFRPLTSNLLLMQGKNMTVDLCLCFWHLLCAESLCCSPRDDRVDPASANWVWYLSEARSCILLNPAEMGSTFYSIITVNSSVYDPQTRR